MGAHGSELASMALLNKERSETYSDKQRDKGRFKYSRWLVNNPQAIAQMDKMIAKLNKKYSMVNLSK